MYFSPTWNLTIAKNTKVLITPFLGLVEDFWGRFGLSIFFIFLNLKSHFFEKHFLKTFLNLRLEECSFVTIIIFSWFGSFCGWNWNFHNVLIFGCLRWCFLKSSNFKFVKNTQIAHNSLLRARRGLLRSFLNFQFFSDFWS